MSFRFDRATGAFVGIGDEVNTLCRARPELAAQLALSARLMEQGDSARALDVVACAANLAVSNVDRRVALRRLSLALQALGRDDEARAIAEGSEPASHGDLLRLIENEQFDLATENALVDLADTTLADNVLGQALAWSDLATVERARGWLTSAVRSMERACGCIQRLPDLDSSVAGWVWLRHATVASDAGRLREAVTSARRAVETVDVRLRGDARLLLARLCCDLGLTAESDRVCASLLEESMSGALPPEFRHAVMAILCTRVMREGGAHGLHATVLLNEELDRLQESNLHVGIPRPFAAPGSREFAEDALARSEERLAEAREQKLRHKLSDAALERARLLLSTGRMAEVDEALDLAQRYGRQANSLENELTVELLRSRAQARRGEHAAARAGLATIQERVAAREDAARWASLQAEAAIESVENAFRSEDPDAWLEHRRLQLVFEQRGLDLARYDLERRIARLLFEREAFADAADAALAAIEAGLAVCATEHPNVVSQQAADVLREDAVLAFQACWRSGQPGAAASAWERVRAAPRISRGYTGRTVAELDYAVSRLAREASVISFYPLGAQAPLYCLLFGTRRECRLLELAVTTEALESPLALFGSPARAVRLDGSLAAEHTSLEAELPPSGPLHVIAQKGLEPFAGLLADWEVIHHPYLERRRSNVRAFRGPAPSGS